MADKELYTVYTYVYFFGSLLEFISWLSDYKYKKGLNLIDPIKF